MSVVVFGASGVIGKFLLPMLEQHGHPVLAISRQAREGNGKADWLRGHLPDGVPQLPSANAIICLGPLDHFAGWLAQADVAGQPQIIAMSSMSACSKQHSPMAAERELAARLRASEDKLARACRARELVWTVLRATLIYGGDSDRSLTPLAQRARRWRVFPLPAGRGLRQPVHAQDLAAAVLAALECDAADGQILEAGGGERLSAAQMFARVRKRRAPHTVPLPLPRALLGLIGLARPRHRGAVARLDQDLVADNRELVNRLGVQPRDFQP